MNELEVCHVGGTRRTHDAIAIPVDVSATKIGTRPVISQDAGCLEIRPVSLSSAIVRSPDSRCPA
ncbi:hypothetical protein QT709_10765 [Xanthomonas citri pv. citri]